MDEKRRLRLLAAFDRVAGSGNQENSQFKVEMMLVSGYAGIGKSALVQELYKPLTAKRVILSGVSLTNLIFPTARLMP